MMQLISVNLGKAQPINAKSGMSGIYKQATDESVYIGKIGLQGDTIVDVENHGGVDQAVYVFGTPDYAWWTAELGVELEPGTFGENLTISGLESAALSIGDRLRIGDVLLEVTGARIPCVTLATRMGDPKFVKRFRHAERPGVYCRVIETGSVQVGEAVGFEPCVDFTVSVMEGPRLYYRGHPTEAEILRMLAAPIDVRSRAWYIEQLEALRTAKAE
jgi:MOSC domain-containing protein YiiM